MRIWSYNDISSRVRGDNFPHNNLPVPMDEGAPPVASDVGIQAAEHLFIASKLMFPGPKIDPVDIRTGLREVLEALGVPVLPIPDVATARNNLATALAQWGVTSSEPLIDRFERAIDDKVGRLMPMGPRTA